MSTAEDVAAARRLLPNAESLPELDGLGRLAARLLGAEAAQVSVLTDVQTVAGGAGLPAGSLGRRSLREDSPCAVVADADGPLVVPDARADPRVAHLPGVLAGAVGSYLGVPLASDESGAFRTIGALCVFDAAPHAWAPSDVTLLEQLAEWAVSELERAALAGERDASQARWQLTIDAAGIGSFDWDLRTGRVEADERLLSMFGLDPGDFDERADTLTACVDAQDVPRVTQAVQAAIDTTGLYEAEYRVVVPGGVTRWVRARGRVLRDEAGGTKRLLGAVLDTTDAREGDGRVVRLLEAMSAAFVSVDRHWQLTYVNAEAERLLGLPRGALVGGDLWQLLPGAVGTPFEAAARRAVETREAETVEAYYPSPLDTWLEVRASPVADGLSLFLLDVSARHATEELVELSAAVGERLSSSLNIDHAVRELARMVVPRLADWSIVSLVDGDATVRDVGTWHADAAQRALVERYSAHRFDGRLDAGPAAETLISGAPVVVTEGTLASALELVRSPVAIEAITALAPESTVVLPLSANGRLAGIFTLLRGAQRPPMSQAELTVSVSIARRAGMALDNARLYAIQRASAERLAVANRRLSQVAAHDRTVAQALQEAMHTELPQPDHLHLASRYLTAAGGEEVGGDWYDAVVLPSGATTVVIGDVVGHDIGAATIMGQLRNMLRTLAWDRDEDPSATVARLDRAMRDLRLNTTATVLVLRIEQEAADRQAGLRTLRWTSAGHLAPILVSADGRPELLDERTDILLGIAPESSRSDQVHPAPEGSTLLLYTDGLVETRTAGVRAGQQQLMDALVRHHALPVDDMLDAVVGDMVGDAPADDVAVLAVRLHAEDGPRPPAAGPSHL